MDINGDGSAVREFTHVADVAEAYLLALDAVKPGEHEVYNIGTGNGGHGSGDHCHRRGRHRPFSPVRMRPAQPEPGALIADSHRARERLGWRPTRSTLRQIIADAWQAEDD